EVSAPADHSEVEADAAADRMVAGQTATVSQASGVSRQIVHRRKHTVEVLGQRVAEWGPDANEPYNNGEPLTPVDYYAMAQAKSTPPPSPAPAANVNFKDAPPPPDNGKTTTAPEDFPNLKTLSPTEDLPPTTILEDDGPSEFIPGIRKTKTQ